MYSKLSTAQADLDIIDEIDRLTSDYQAQVAAHLEKLESGRVLIQRSEKSYAELARQDLADHLQDWAGDSLFELGEEARGFVNMRGAA